MLTLSSEMIEAPLWTTSEKGTPVPVLTYTFFGKYSDQEIGKRVMICFLHSVTLEERRTLTPAECAHRLLSVIPHTTLSILFPRRGWWDHAKRFLECATIIVKTNLLQTPSLLRPRISLPAPPVVT